MRRLILHAMAGVGVSAVAATVAVTGLAGPTLAAEPAVPVKVSVASASPRVALDDRHLSQSRGEVRHDLPAAAAATKPAAVATRAAAAKAAAGQRRRALGTQQKAIATKQFALVQKQAAFARQQKAAAEAARQRIIRAGGYEPGTTDPRAMAKQILTNKFSYPDSEYRCFDNIIMRESAWDVNATNASSGAYGIPQALPGYKMASVAPDWRTNPATQVIWGTQYMKSRYGSPCAAWGFKSTHGWY